MDDSQLLSNAPAQVAETPCNPWVVHLGPFSVGSDGLDVKPQFKLGGQFGCVRADYGIGDVREGLKLDMSLNAQAEAVSNGQSIAELHEGIRQALCVKSDEAGKVAQSWGLDMGDLSRGCFSADSGALAQALDTAGKILSTSASGAGSQVTRIAAACSLEVETFRRALEEDPPSPMTLRVTASTGFGMNMKLCLGWGDRDGYCMVGVGTRVTTGLTMGGDVFAGKHRSGTSLKILIGVGNFAFEYTVPVRTTKESSGEKPAVNPTVSS